MQSYEVVREVENQCANNQMRDIFFEEIETDDPVGWLRGFVKGRDVEMSVDKKENGDLTVFVTSGGVTQKFLFTKILSLFSTYFYAIFAKMGLSLPELCVTILLYRIRRGKGSANETQFYHFGGKL